MFPEKEFVRRFHPREIVALGGILKERGYPGQIKEVIQTGEWVIAVFEFDKGRLYPVACGFSGREVGLHGVESTGLSIFGEGTYRLESYLDVVNGGKITNTRDPEGEITWLVTVPGRLGEGEVLLRRKLSGEAGRVGRITYSWTDLAQPVLFEVTMEDPMSIGLSRRYEYRNGTIFLVDSSPEVKNLPWRLASPIGFDLVAKDLFDPRCDDLHKYPFWIKKGISW